MVDLDSLKAYEAKMKETNPLFDIKTGAYLHTTMVCIWALIVTG